MPVNDLSPGFVKVYYGTSGRTSVQTLPVDPINPSPGTTGNELANYSGGTTTLAAFATQYGPLMADFTGPAYTIIFAELWSKPLPTSNPIFIESVPIGLPGTGNPPDSGATQVVMTHRTTNGGLHRWYFIGASGDPDQRASIASAPARALAMSNYLIGNDSVVFGRDNGKLFAPLFYTSKINDAVRKDILGL